MTPGFVRLEPQQMMPFLRQSANDCGSITPRVAAHLDFSVGSIFGILMSVDDSKHAPMAGGVYQHCGQETRAPDALLADYLATACSIAGTVYIENALFLPTDPLLEKTSFSPIKTSSGVVLAAECPLQRRTALELIRAGRHPPVTVGTFVSLSLKDVSRHVSNAKFERIAQSVSTMFFSAYDQESFIVWRRSDS